MTMVIISDSTYNNTLESVADAVEKFDINFKGKTVLIKPNILCATPAEAHITTHPTIVAAVIHFLERKGARQVSVGDIPGVEDAESPFQAAKACGILDIAKDRFIDLAQKTGFIDLNPNPIGPVEISALLQEFDIIINVPKFKTHCRTFLTGAVKNMFGVVVGKERQRIHRDAKSSLEFSRVLVDIYTFCKPTITIVDAIIGMEGNGPISKQLRKIGKIIVSDDGIAVDTVMANMMGVPWKNIPILDIAHEKGLGRVDISKIHIEGCLSTIPDFRMPATFYVDEFSSKDFPTFVGHAVNLELNRSSCTKCGTCAGKCPVSAIKLNPFPEADPLICIGCYCCHELCPESAWIVVDDPKGNGERRMNVSYRETFPPGKGKILGGGINEHLIKGSNAAEIEKRHLVINRIMGEKAAHEGIHYIDVGTDYHYPFYKDYIPTKRALESIKEHVHTATHYPSSYGLVQLRSEFVRFMKRQFQVELDSHNEVMITTGASQVFDAVSRIYRGEYFIVPDLALPTVSSIAVANGAKPIRAPLDNTTGLVDIPGLRRILESKGFHSIRFLYINYPLNPTGAIGTEEFLRELVCFAREYNILVIHDMDSWYTRHDREYRPLLNLLQIEGAREIGITVISVSKEFGLPGLRIGLVGGNKRVINSIREHNSIFCVMLPEFCQQAVITALREFTPHKQKRSINQNITKILNLCVRGWKNLGWPPEKIYNARGGFKFRVEVPPAFVGTESVSKAELFDYYIVKNAKVKFSTSRSFNPDNSNFIRMVIMQEKEVMEEVFRRLKKIGVNYDMMMPGGLVREYHDFLVSPDFVKINNEW